MGPSSPAAGGKPNSRPGGKRRHRLPKSAADGNAPPAPLPPRSLSPAGGRRRPPPFPASQRCSSTYRLAATSPQALAAVSLSAIGDPAGAPLSSTPPPSPRPSTCKQTKKRAAGCGSLLICNRAARRPPRKTGACRPPRWPPGPAKSPGPALPPAPIAWTCSSSSPPVSFFRFILPPIRPVV